MNKDSENVAKEIEQLNPYGIVISGCVDPTYSTECFFEVLIPSIKLQFGRFVTKTSLWDRSIRDWIKKSIEAINPDYELIKVKNVYIVGESPDPRDYTDGDEVVIDYGGEIELIFLDRLK
jgi:hypothetical protein